MSRSSIELVPVTYPSSAVTNPSLKSTATLDHVPSIASQDGVRTETRSLGTQDVSKGITAAVITSVTCVTGISSLLAGIVTVAMPIIAQDLNIPSNLQLWPASVYALTCGCTLLVLGSIADVVGSRIMYLTGCVLQSIFTLACGLARNGLQLILFRALAGIAISFCLPSAVSIITNTFPSGQRRNISFASMGAGQPVGFTIGLALGGVFSDSIGWRWCFYTAAILNTATVAVAIFTLPKTPNDSAPVTWSRFRSEIDWVGALMASTSMAMISYVFASLTGSASHIRDPAIIALLTVALALIPAFIMWMSRQNRLGKPAIIPNTLWRSRHFTAICLEVFFIWGIFNGVENLLAFFFVYVQHLSGSQASLRFLPAPIGGGLAFIIIALTVHRVRANRIVIVALVVSSLTPLLLAIQDPSWTYWAAVAPAVLLNATGADTLFTVANLVISSAFPSKTQALAGGVFNTVAQVGKSVGIATSAVIAGSVTARVKDGSIEDALMEGYRAAFWYALGLSILCIVISVWGLRNIGRVGIKRE